MSFGGGGPQDAVTFIEHREICDVRLHKVSCTTDDRPQKVPQRQRAGEIMRRVDKKIEAAFADPAIADNLSDGLQMPMQRLDVLGDRRCASHRVDHFCDF